MMIPKKRAISGIRTVSYRTTNHQRTILHPASGLKCPTKRLAAAVPAHGRTLLTTTSHFQ
jgi:hypothetical protein